MPHLLLKITTVVHSFAQKGFLRTGRWCLSGFSHSSTSWAIAYFCGAKDTRLFLKAQAIHWKFGAEIFNILLTPFPFVVQWSARNWLLKLLEVGGQTSWIKIRINFLKRKKKCEPFSALIYGSIYFVLWQKQGMGKSFLKTTDKILEEWVQWFGLVGISKLK